MHHLAMAMGDFQTYFSLFLICLISTILFRAFSKCNYHAKSPPTPFALPIIGHLHLLSPIPHQAFYKLSSRYGPIFRVFLGSKPCVVVCSPEMAKEFFKTHEHVYLDRPINNITDYLTYGSKDFILAPYGPYWKFMKKIVMSQLLNKTTLDSLSSVRQDEINRFMKALSENAEVGKSVDLGKELMKLTNNVISRMIMGERCTDHKDEGKDDVMKLIADMVQVAGNFNLSDYIWLFKSLDLQGLGKKVKKLRARFDVLIERIIKEHEEARKHKEMTTEAKDLLHILLNIQQDESMEIKLSRENIKAFIQNIFTAATDTLASTLEWALSLLINHPKIMNKAIEEIHQVVGKNRLLEESDIPNLPYLQAIVKETLRLYPAAPVIPRQSMQDCNVAGYHIPSKTSIFINVWALGRDPSYWQNPHVFMPERFDERKLDLRGQNFQMLPFGSGRRMCPGISLALLMIQTTLGAMIQCFEWKAGENGTQTTVDMKEGFALTLPRANPLVCVPVARQDLVPFSM